MPHCQQHCSSGCQEPVTQWHAYKSHMLHEAQGRASQSRAVLVVPWVCQWTGELLRGRALLNDILRIDETHFGMASYSAIQKMLFSSGNSLAAFGAGAVRSICPGRFQCAAEGLHLRICQRPASTASCDMLSCSRHMSTAGCPDSCLAAEQSSGC